MKFLNCDEWYEYFKNNLEQHKDCKIERFVLLKSDYKAKFIDFISYEKEGIYCSVKGVGNSQDYTSKFDEDEKDCFTIYDNKEEFKNKYNEIANQTKFCIK